jgi:hypothetical protein
VGQNTIKLASSLADANAGTPVDIKSKVPITAEVPDTTEYLDWNIILETLKFSGSAGLDLTASVDKPFSYLINEDPWLKVEIADIAHPSPVFTHSNLDDLFKFNNTEFSFKNIILALRALTDFLRQYEHFGFLDKLPS